MAELVPPHGSDDLRPPQVPEGARVGELRHVETLRRLTITSREKGNVVMLGIGGFTPLQGFMTQADWRGVCDDMCISNGAFWPIPITLPTDSATAGQIAIEDEVALIDPDDGSLFAVLTVSEKYRIDKAYE